MPPGEFLSSFLNGTPPRNIRLVAARGIAPLPPDEMLELLVHLSRDSDPAVALQAKNTIAGWEQDELLSILRTPRCTAAVLETVADSVRSDAVLEAIILNAATPLRVIEGLASKLPGHLLETVLCNRVRLLECPGILTQVKLNSAITPDAARLIREIEEEFFGDKRTVYRVDTSVAIEPEVVAAAGLTIEEASGDLSLEGLPLDPDEREFALSERIGRMTVRQKIQLALLGTREARSILIRDSNKQVALSVLQSPKLTDSEVESFTSMRNVSDEILRVIANNRSWVRSYAVVQNLVHNPKTPPTISQRLLIRLLNKDLASVARDRGLPEAVRRNAERALSQRSAQKAKG